jgi:hypothetical protein
MRASIAISVIIVVCWPAALFPAATMSWAQAGSTGGTLGRTDKSVSGGDEPTRDRSASRKSAAAKPAEHKQAGNDCNRVVGVWQWRWLNETSVVTLNANGTGSSAHGFKSTWTCSNRTAVIRWPMAQDTMVLSSDGKKLTGSNNVGVAVTGSRL